MTDGPTGTDGGGAGAAEPPPSQVPPAPKPRPTRRPLPSPLAVIVATLGLFFVVLTLLAIQVRIGRDPALGPGPVIQVVGKGGTKGTGTASQATSIVTRTSPAPPP